MNGSNTCGGLQSKSLFYERIMDYKTEKMITSLSCSFVMFIGRFTAYNLRATPETEPAPPSVLAVDLIRFFLAFEGLTITGWPRSG